MRGFRSSLVFSSAAVLALRDGRSTGTDSGTFSPSLQPKQKPWVYSQVSKRQAFKSSPLTSPPMTLPSCSVFGLLWPWSLSSDLCKHTRVTSQCWVTFSQPPEKSSRNKTALIHRTTCVTSFSSFDRFGRIVCSSLCGNTAHVSTFTDLFWHWQAKMKRGDLWVNPGDGRERFDAGARCTVCDDVQRLSSALTEELRLLLWLRQLMQHLLQSTKTNAIIYHLKDRESC